MRARLSGFVLVILVLVLGASTLAASTRPPRSLHLVGDHWTAWDPPAPPATPDAQVYIIVRGDTLWDLAKRFYGDPYLWPQLWEKNQYIRDAHWIYPGDPLATGLKVAPVENLANVPPASGAVPAPAPSAGEPKPVPPPEVPGVESSAQAAKAPIPLGGESDIYCSGYVGELDEKLPYRISGSEHGVEVPGLYRTREVGNYGNVRAGKYDLSTGDIVYVNAGQRQGLSVGSQLSVVRPGRTVAHPARHNVLGRVYQYLGRVRILSVQEESAIAEITQGCDAIRVGAAMIPFEPEPVPLMRPTPMRPVNFPVSADKLKDAPVILLSKDDIFSLGQDSVVYIDRGSDQDVSPGDAFTIYRANLPGLPPVVVGELAVLSVKKKFALAKITQSRYFVFVGDLLDPK
jgi:hypothetical protein